MQINIFFVTVHLIGFSPKPRILANFRIGRRLFSRCERQIPKLTALSQSYILEPFRALSILGLLRGCFRIALSTDSCAAILRVVGDCVYEVKG